MSSIPYFFVTSVLFLLLILTANSYANKEETPERLLRVVTHLCDNERIHPSDCRMYKKDLQTIINDLAIYDFRYGEYDPRRI